MDIGKAVKMLLNGATWNDIGDTANKVINERHFPPGDRRVIVAYNEIDGLPEETRDIPWPHSGYYSHFWLNANPKVDNITHRCDVAVGRESCWHHAQDEWCLVANAVYKRSDAEPNGSFRPVKGSIPEIQKSI